MLSRSILFHDKFVVKMRYTSLRQLSQELLNKGSKCGALRGSLSKFLARSDKPFELNTFEFENIISSYPASNQIDELTETDMEQNRLDARGEMAVHILSSRILGPSQMGQGYIFNCQLVGLLATANVKILLVP